MNIDNFIGLSLSDVFIYYDCPCIEKIIFSFEIGCISIVVLPNTDELLLSYIPPLSKKQTSAYTKVETSYINKKLSIAWECKNNMGYNDLFILGFEYLHPNLYILSEGSSLKLITIDENIIIPHFNSH